MLCGYDTTFKLGNFYVSPFTFRHVLFEGSPVVPLAFLFHEKKDEKFHNRFFSILKENIPNLSKKEVKIVVDKERGLTNAIESVFPQWHVFHCWNHIRSDLKYWVKNHGGKKDDYVVWRQIANGIRE